MCVCVVPASCSQGEGGRGRGPAYYKAWGRQGQKEGCVCGQASGKEEEKQSMSQPRLMPMPLPAGRGGGRVVGSVLFREGERMEGGWAVRWEGKVWRGGEVLSVCLGQHR